MKKNMRKNLIYALSAFAVLMLPGCGSKNKTTETEQTKILVKTAAVEEKTIQQNVEFTSNIEPYKQNYVTPAVSGLRIDQILVDVGDNVRKGQLLVKMDPITYSQQLVTLQNMENNLARSKKVYETGGISSSDFEQLETSVQVQRDVVANLKKNIELRSPIDGVVTARNDEAGNLFGNQPILQLMQINPLKVKVSISEQYYPNVKLGMPVRLTADIFPGREFEGKVSLIYPAMDASTRTFTVEVTIPNSEKVLRPGMSARSIFNMGDKQGVMIPDIAVMRQVGTNDRVVYVIKDGVAERRVVTTGRTVDGMIDILSGVELGEQVAVTSMSKLNTGTEVEVRNN